MPALGGIVFSLAILAGPSAAAAAGGWSPAVVISPSQPSPTPSAFAIDSTGNELWVAAPPVVGGYAVEVSQRSFGGTWSPQTTIFSVTNRFITTLTNLYASVGANHTATVAWQAGGSIQVALRSTSGAWAAPVSVAPSSGGGYNLVTKADAQGNGVAVWSQATASGSAVDAIAWTAAGVFSGITQLSVLAPSELQPDLAVNEAGTAIATFSAPTTPGGSSYQTYSATRPAGGNWSAATTVPITGPGAYGGVALDGAGDATVLWEQGTTIASTTRSAGGSWSGPAVIETSTFAGPSSLASDAAGDLTATWVVNSGSGVISVHAASRPAGSPWGAPANLGACLTTCIPILAASRDGSIAAVGFTTATASLSAAVRLGLGTWSSSVIGSGSTRVTNLIAGNNAVASAVWPANIQVKYHVALKQVDYR
jgi:hypothetical protein